MDLPNLDYAFLAEYAKVEPTGLLTAVGASFTQLNVQQFPAAQLLSVGGRLRMAEKGPPFSLTLTFSGPELTEPGEVRLQMQVSHGSEAAYAGRVGVLFAATTIVPIMRRGLHRVAVTIEDELVRELFFEARTPDEP